MKEILQEIQTLQNDTDSIQKEIDSKKNEMRILENILKTKKEYQKSLYDLLESTEKPKLLAEVEIATVWSGVFSEKTAKTMNFMDINLCKEKMRDDMVKYNKHTYCFGIEKWWYIITYQIKKRL